MAQFRNGPSTVKLLCALFQLSLVCFAAEVSAQSTVDVNYPDGLPPIIDILDGEITVGENAPAIGARTLADRRTENVAPSVDYAPVRASLSVPPTVEPDATLTVAPVVGGSKTAKRKSRSATRVIPASSSLPPVFESPLTDSAVNFTTETGLPSMQSVNAASAAPIFELPSYETPTVGGFSPQATSVIEVGEPVFELPASQPPPAESKKYPTARLTGFFQMDSLWYSNPEFADGIQFATVNIDDVRGFRRARLAAVGSVADNVDYMVEFDFAFPGRPNFMDLYFDVHGFQFGSLRVGQWRQPFGLDELTSIRELTFHERSSTFFLGPFRRPGIGIYGHDGRSTYAISAYGTNFTQAPDLFGGSRGDSNYGLAARGTTLLVDRPRDGGLLHAGFGYALMNDSTSLQQFVFLPELAGPPGELSSRGLNTATEIFGSNRVHLFNAEFAAVRGPGHAQGEYRVARFEQSVDPAVTTPSYYAQVGYLLTGETREYNRSGGVLSAVRPDNPFGPGGWGAWELAARFSRTETVQGGGFFQDGVFNPGGFRGSRTTYSVGLNWYLNDFTKFQFNYLRGDIVQPSFEITDYAIYAVRAQVAF